MNNKKILYENIMRQVSKEVKMILERDDDDDDYDDYEPDPCWHALYLYYNVDTEEVFVFSDEYGEDLDVLGRYVEYELEVSDWHVENDGIGSYEFWGQQCYDKGTDYCVIDDFSIEEYDTFELTEDGDINKIEIDTKDIDTNKLSKYVNIDDFYDN